MALSNWDTLAIDLDGKPTNGVFVSPKSGVTVELYKNWTHIRDPKGWHEGGGYVEDVVAQVEQGSIRYHDIHVEAIRGPQNGIYVACWTVDWTQKDEEGKPKPKYYGMIGCGVYGYDKHDWVGVEKESLQFLKDWVSKREKVWDEEEITNLVEDLKEEIREGMAKQGYRETPEQYAEYLKNQTRYIFDKEIAEVDFSKALRFNQGDGFFEDALGIDPSGTPVEEGSEPVLMKMLKGESNDNKGSN